MPLHDPRTVPVRPFGKRPPGDLMHLHERRYHDLADTLRASRNPAEREAIRHELEPLCAILGWPMPTFIERELVGAAVVRRRDYRASVKGASPVP